MGKSIADQIRRQLSDPCAVAIDGLGYLKNGLGNFTAAFHHNQPATIFSALSILVATRGFNLALRIVFWGLTLCSSFLAIETLRNRNKAHAFQVVA
jgi:hypothetical protein